MTPIRALLFAAAGAALLAGCASRPKAQPEPPVAEAPPPPPAAEAPPQAAPPAYATLQDELAATAGDRVFFAFDSDAVEAEARDTLRRQAEWLRARPDVRARIAGNADERGTRDYNLALGARRAAAVRQALIAMGIAADRLETISYGKERPLDPGSNEEAWARNRNAQTVLIGIGGL